MAVLIRPKQALRQRPSNPQINWDHDLGKDLAFSIVPDGLGAPIDLVSGRKMTTFGTFGQSMTELGPAIKFDGSSTAFSIPLNLSSSNRIQVSAWFYAESWPVSVLAELTANYNTNPGSFGLFGGDGGFGSWTGTNWITADAHDSGSGTITADGCIEPSTGRLHHISAQFTRDLADNTIWLDGVAQTMIRPGTTANTPMPGNFGNDTLYIGARAGTGAGTFLNGRLLALSIYRRGLKQDETQRLYAEPFVFLQPPPRQRYWTTGLKLGASRRTKPWGSQKPPPATQVNWGHPLTQGLVGAWLFNEGGGAKVQNLAGPLQGSLLNTYAWSPEGVEMSTDNSAINRTNLGDIRITGDMTILCSYTPLRLIGASDVGVITKWDSGARPANDEWSLGQNFFAASADGRQHFGVAVGSSTGFAAAASGDSVVPGTRYALVGTRRGTALTLYRNGNIIGTGTGPSGALNTGTGRVVKIGEIDNGAGNNTNARFHYAYLWNRALSQEEIQRLLAHPYAFLQSSPRWQPTSALTLPELPVVQNLKGWWKADSIVQADNTAVTSWEDSSGGGNDATQATSARQPTYRASVINGRPAVRFTAASSQYVQSALSVARGAGAVYELFAVVQPTSTGTSRAIAGTTASSGLEWRINSSNVQEVLRAGVAPFAVSATPVGTSVVLLETILDETTGTGFVSFYQNGSNAGSGNNPTTLTGAGTLQIGASLGTEGFDGYIAELLIYDRVLTPAERISVESYLATKYGLASPFPRRTSLFDQAVRRASVI